MEGLLLDNVDVAGQLAVFTDRHVERSDLLAVESGQILDYLAVGHLIDVHVGNKEHARQMVFLTDVPGLLGAGLDAGLGAYHDDGAVCNGDGLFYLADEIKVSGGIEHIQLIVVPLDRDQ